jgi:Na+/proline symporter
MRICVDLPMMFWLWFVGLGIWVFYQHQPEGMRPDAPDQALFRFITSELPHPVPGLIVAALMAAVMSTLDSGINSLATVFTKDFYARFHRSDPSETSQLHFSRWMTVLTGVVAMAVALMIASISEAAESTVLETSWLWMSLNSVIPAAFLLAVFSRRATGRHVLGALGVGTVWAAVLVILYLHANNAGKPTISPFYIGASAMVVTIVVGVVLSRFGKRKSQEELDDLTLWTLR